MPEKQDSSGFQIGDTIVAQLSKNVSVTVEITGISQNGWLKFQLENGNVSSVKPSDAVRVNE